MRMTVLKMRLTCKQKCDRDVSAANCGLWNMRCSIYKVEIISLACRWLIVRISAIKTRDQTHRGLKNVFAAS